MMESHISTDHRPSFSRMWSEPAGERRAKPVQTIQSPTQNNGGRGVFFLDCSLPPGAKVDSWDSFGPLSFTNCGFYSVSVVLHNVLKQEEITECNKFSCICFRILLLLKWSTNACILTLASWQYFEVGFMFFPTPHSSVSSVFRQQLFATVVFSPFNPSSALFPFISSSDTERHVGPPTLSTIRTINNNISKKSIFLLSKTLKIRKKTSPTSKALNTTSNVHERMKKKKKPSRKRQHLQELILCVCECIRASKEQELCLRWRFTPQRSC